jgi:ech hydrogenase subunit A
LVLFPLLTAGLLLAVRKDRGRDIIVVASAVLIVAGTILLAVLYFTEGPWQDSVDSAAVSGIGGVALSTLITYATLAIDLLIAAYILVRSIQHKKPLAGVLAVVQAGVILYYELVIAHNVIIVNDLYVDGLSVIMALIIGIIGGGICIYALGYMKDFQHHAAHAHHTSVASEGRAHVEDPEAEASPKAKDRRPMFFALMFLFLSAMFGIVFSNNLNWLLCAWELTTVCSFALIGYTRTAEAINNSFRQIVMNLLGGLAFAIALFYLGTQGIGELDILIAMGSMGKLVLPIAFIAFAGMTKAAQVPFQSWLLGAMVAPTPTSALLHSSTMVKAGVFILIKLAPTFGWTGNGLMVMLVGALTFLFCSAIAVSQSNAKRVLAYSTVANLGLIVACAGVGTAEAVWAAIFLLIFHAAAKSLLFLCVGTAEHHIDSRDIEDMDNLFVRMPVLARLMALGVLTMFAAPFGMLISKWATIVSLVETSNITLLIILAFGSAVTFMFWAKWLGKLLGAASREKSLETSVHASEWVSLALMAVLVVGLSAGFPFISEYVVVPYLVEFGGSVFPFAFAAPGGLWATGSLATIDFDNLLIMALIVLLIIVCFLIFFGKTGKKEAVEDVRATADEPGAQDARATQVAKPAKRNVPVYLGGVGLDFENRTYRNSLSQESQASQRNWYLEGLFGEGALTPVANTMCIVILLLGVALALVSLGGWSL